MKKALSILLAILALLMIAAFPAALALDAQEPVYLCTKTTRQSSDGSSSVQEYTYDEKGDLINTTAVYRDSDGSFTEETTAYTYDETGVLTRETFSAKDYSKGKNEPQAFRFTDDTYVYDEKGNLVQTTHIYKDSGGENTKLDYALTYDDQGRLVKEVCSGGDGEAEVWTNAFDERGNLTKETYTCGKDRRITVSTFNNSGNLTKSVVTYQMDGEKGKTVDTFIYDRKGNLIKEKSLSVDSTGYFEKSVSAYVYDRKGNMIKEAYTYAGLYGVGREVIRYRYDKAGKLTAETRKCLDATEAGTYKVRYTYNENGDIAKEVMVYLGTYGVLGRSVKTYTYDSDRNLVAETEKYKGLTGTNESSHTVSFDSAGRTVNEKTSSSSSNRFYTSETSESNDYTYDAHGNLTQRVDEYKYDDTTSKHVWTFEYQKLGE